MATGTLVRPQATAPSSTESPPAKTTITAVAAEEEKVVPLSPFVVEDSRDTNRYLAESTLAGTRLRTDLKDIASSISVVTSDFLRDVGATNNQTLLVYTTNTEVGGVSGNYAGVGSTFIDGASEASNFLKPGHNTRVRGLDSADNTRDYFLTDLPWDSYIVDRVDLQRGPNSILFGLGSPAGIINASLERAAFKTGGNVETRLGSFGTVRFSLDYNHVLRKNELALRVAALDDRTKYRQEPAFNHDQRVYAALRWDPRIFGNSAHTSVRANFEHGDVDANRPRVLPPWDRITPFFPTSSPGNSLTTPSPGLNRQTYDPFYTWAAGIIGYSGANVFPGEQKNFWVVQFPGPTIQATANPMFIYAGADQASPSLTIQAGPNTYWGLGVHTDNNQPYRDAGINGFPFGSNIGIGSYNEYAYNYWRANPGSTAFPAADKGFYKQKSLTDTSIFDFFNNLIDGPNKRETQAWDAGNIALEQTLFNNRLGLELVYDRQKYQDRETRNLGDAFISVDIRQNLMVYPWAYPDLVRPNPNAGRAFTGAGRGGVNNANFSDRENIRATAFAEVRAADYLSNPILRSVFGRHLFTGLCSREIYQGESRRWSGYAVDSSYSEAIGNGGWAHGNDPNGDNPSGIYGSRVGGLVNGDVNLDVITYLSGDLRGRPSASGLNLPRITAVQSPSGIYRIPYFDSHWNAVGIDPAAEWVNPTVLAWPGAQPIQIQAENPRNYVGWVSGQFNVLNGTRGDIDQLYTGVGKLRKKTESRGLTWQGYLLGDTIVATVGRRSDSQEQCAGNSTAANEPSRIAQPNPDLAPPTSEDAVSKGTTWGVVVHTPKFLRKKLPFRSNLSLTYSDGRNERVENRYGFNGEALPNTKGRTRDLGVLLSVLDDRLRFKVTRYQTDLQDANLSSVTTEVSTLGNNTYYLYLLEAWGTAGALFDLAGRDGGAEGLEWFWNWAFAAHNGNRDYADPNSTRFKNDPQTQLQTVAVNSWLSQLQPQWWFDAYGFAINVERARAGDWRNAIAGWTPSAGVGTIQAAGRGRINGSWPTGTANNQSKGFEFEIAGQPLKNWNLSINASKTHAAQTALGAGIVTFIEAQHAKLLTPAGDLRLWWAGDSTIRQYYEQNIWSPYQFQSGSNGRMVPEMAPWRVNIVTNYSFERGRLKGANLGLGYRWQDGRIIGYALNAAQTNLDVNKPYWSDRTDWIDMWIGYQRKLSEKLTWRGQLNLQSLGRRPTLVPLSLQPDGTPAAFKIQEGFTWAFTNTLSF
jgi:outer membrane receptor protein involved in Fe transport